MRNLVSRLEKLELNFKKVLHRYKMVSDENQILKQENALLKKQLNATDIGLVAGNREKTDEQDAVLKKNISSKIDEYIVEIDACIDYLKQESGS